MSMTTPHAPSTPPHAPAPGTKFRILVIEDDAEVARLILLNLSRAGLDCRYAPDGPTGLSAFHEADPHLVLLDLMLPGFDGRAVCMQIREKSTVPVIIMTALSGEEPALQCFKLGADDFVTKPFNPKLLMARVVAHLRRVYAYDSEFEGETEPAAPISPSVPPGYARCDACGYSGPQRAFEAASATQTRALICPRCKRKDDIVVAIG
jgi:DNA-binding response OmpR family regulator